MGTLLSWWGLMARSSGGLTTAARPTIRCTCQYPTSSPTSARDSKEARRSMNILLLTQENCGFCKQAKELLDRLAVEYGLSISTLDLDSSEGQVLAMRGGVLFPPGIFIDSEPFSYGRPSERKLRREIDRRLRSVEGSTLAPLGRP